MPPETRPAHGIVTLLVLGLLLRLPWTPIPYSVPLSKATLGGWGRPYTHLSASLGLRP